MKVLIIETGGWGGICHYTFNLANALSKKGVETVLLSNRRYELEGFRRRFTLIKKIDSERGYIHNLKEIIRVIRRGNFPLIHIQSILSPRRDWMLLYAFRLLKKKTVYTVHNILPHEEGEREARGVRRAFLSLYRNATHLIAHSEANKEELSRSFGIEEERITVIPHGNYLFLLPEGIPERGKILKEFGLHGRERIVLFFGAVRRYKGIDILIKAFKDVEKAIPDARLLIVGKPLAVGEDAPHEEYIHLAHELGIEKKVIFRLMYIPLEEIHKYFTIADLAVYPYRDTTESGSIQLALAFSKPVIASDVGSFRYAIDEGKNGLIVPPGDEASLSRAMIDLLSMPGERLLEMGVHSRRIAETRYRWEDIAEKTVDLYRRVLLHAP